MVCFIYTFENYLNWILFSKMKKAFVCSPYVTRMHPYCYFDVSVLYLYVTRVRIMSWVSDPYVTRMHSYVTCMLLVCIRMHPYVTCMLLVFVCIRVWCFSQEIVTLSTTSYYLLLKERRDRAHKKFFKKAQNSVKKGVYFLEMSRSS